MSYLDRVLENEAETVKIPNSVELNGSLKVGGVTIIPATQTVMNAVTASAAELNLNDGAVAGASVASKTLALGANKNTDILGLPVGGLKVGPAGTETVVTSSGAELNILTGVTASAAEINLLVQGVAAGYKIARGTITPVSESDTVVTGLATVVAAVASLKGAPTLTCMFVAADIGNQAGAPAAGSIYIKTYKPTATTDVTPTSSTTPWSAIDWIAIGT